MNIDNLTVNEMLVEALKLMGVGVGTVFAVLAVLAGSIILMCKLLPAKEGDPGNT